MHDRGRQITEPTLAGMVGCGPTRDPTDWSQNPRDAARQIDLICMS